MLGHNSFGAMVTPDSQSLARLPCPIHDDDSGRGAEPRTALPGGRCVRRSELTITTVISKQLQRVASDESARTLTTSRSEDIRALISGTRFRMGCSYRLCIRRGCRTAHSLNE